MFQLGTFDLTVASNGLSGKCGLLSESFPLEQDRSIKFPAEISGNHFWLNGNIRYKL